MTSATIHDQNRGICFISIATTVMCELGYHKWRSVYGTLANPFAKQCERCGAIEYLVGGQLKTLFTSDEFEQFRRDITIEVLDLIESEKW